LLQLVAGQAIPPASPLIHPRPSGTDHRLLWSVVPVPAAGSGALAERLDVNDIRQAAVVMAWYAYNAAMSDERIPRPAVR